MPNDEGFAKISSRISRKMLNTIYSNSISIKNVVYSNRNMPHFIDLANALMRNNKDGHQNESVYIQGIKERARKTYFWIYECSNPICERRRRTLIQMQDSMEVVGQWNKFMRCKGCLTAAYCSKRCQKIHWNRYNHRQQCVDIQNSASRLT